LKVSFDSRKDLIKDRRMTDSGNRISQECPNTAVSLRLAKPVGVVGRDLRRTKAYFRINSHAPLFGAWHHET
jgi:hypothetical protein